MERQLVPWRRAHNRRRQIHVASRRILVIATLAVATLVAGCATPFSMGLSGDIPSGGTTGTSSVIIETLPDHLWLTGSYEVRSGALTIEVQAPDGSIPYTRSLEAITQGRIREELEPSLGEWIITVVSAGGEGSYDVRLEY